MTSEFELVCDDNASSNGTSELWLVEDKVTGQILAAFLLLILVMGLPWNLLVVLTIVKEKLYHQPTIVVLLCLTLNNILLLVIEFPLRIVTGFAGEFIHGSTDSVRCTVCTIGSLSIAFSIMSLYIIATLAFDRFLFIYKPLHYEKIVTSCRMTLVMAVMLVVLFLVLSLPPSLAPWFAPVTYFDPAFLTCIPNYTNRRDYYLILLMILAVIPVLLLVVFNVWVVVIVQKNIRAIYGTKHTLGQGKERDSHHNEFNQLMRKKKHQKQLHLFNVFGALLGSCLTTWLPLISIMIYLLIAETEARLVSTEVVAAFTGIFISQVALYPIIETVVIKDVRKPMKKLLVKCFCCCKLRKKSEVDPSKSEKGRSCEDSAVRCCCKFMSVLHAAVVLEHSRHNSSACKEEVGKTQELALSTDTISKLND